MLCYESVVHKGNFPIWSERDILTELLILMSFRVFSHSSDSGRIPAEPCQYELVLTAYLKANPTEAFTGPSCLFWAE